METPTFTPVTADAMVSTGAFPSHGMNTPTGSGIQESEILPILLMESGEPIQMENGEYLFEEGL